MSFKKILGIVIVGLTIITVGGLLIVYSFTDIKLSDVDGNGELVETIKSPEKNYQADTYVIYGNTSEQDQVRVSVTDTKNKEQFNDTTVYWLYPKGEGLPNVKWSSEEELQIDDQKIDIMDKKTYYNYRKDKDLAR